MQAGRPLVNAEDTGHVQNNAKPLLFNLAKSCEILIGCIAWCAIHTLGSTSSDKDGLAI